MVRMCKWRGSTLCPDSCRQSTESPRWIPRVHAHLGLGMSCTRWCGIWREGRTMFLFARVCVFSWRSRRSHVQSDFIRTAVQSLLSPRLLSGACRGGRRQEDQRLVRGACRQGCEDQCLVRGTDKIVSAVPVVEMTSTRTIVHGFASAAFAQFHCVSRTQVAEGTSSPRCLLWHRLVGMYERRGELGLYCVCVFHGDHDGSTFGRTSLF